MLRLSVDEARLLPKMRGRAKANSLTPCVSCGCRTAGLLCRTCEEIAEADRVEQRDAA